MLIRSRGCSLGLAVGAVVLAAVVVRSLWYCLLGLVDLARWLLTG